MKTTAQNYLDCVLCQDSKDLSLLPDALSNAVISSWAWESQVHYGDNPENLGGYRGQEFIERAVQHLRALIPKVRPDGNILIELQSAIRDGESSLSEEQFAIAAVEKCGLHLVQKLYSIRTNAEPLAPPNRLRRGVVPIFHLVRDPKLYKVFKDAIRTPSRWASRDSRPNKYNANGKDPGDLLWSREGLLRAPDYQVLNAAGPDMNFIAAPKAQNHGDLDHPAVMSDALAEALVLYATPPNGIVLDNMSGVGTTLVAAKKHGRRFIGFEINPKFAATARQRLGIAGEGSDVVMKEWMNSKEVASYSGFSIATIYSKKSRGEIPVHCGSGEPRYHRAEIDAWLRGEWKPASIQAAQNSAKVS